MNQSTKKGFGFASSNGYFSRFLISFAARVPQGCRKNFKKETRTFKPIARQRTRRFFCKFDLTVLIDCLAKDNLGFFDGDLNYLVGFLY
jgi:hypothetical protein